MAGVSFAIEQNDADQSCADAFSGAADKRGSSLPVEHVDIGVVRVGCQPIEPRAGGDGLPALRATELAFQDLDGWNPYGVEVVTANSRQRPRLERAYCRRLPATGYSCDDENSRDPHPELRFADLTLERPLSAERRTQPAAKPVG